MITPVEGQQNNAQNDPQNQWILTLDPLSPTYVVEGEDITFTGSYNYPNRFIPDGIKVIGFVFMKRIRS